MAERPPVNLSDLLEDQAARSPNKEFLFLESGDRLFTYRQFDQAVNRAADALVALGATKGERVNLLLANRAEYLIFYFACFKIGAWAGPINALLKPREIEYILSDSEASIAVTQPDLLPHFEQACRNVTSLRHLIVIQDSGSWTMLDKSRNSGSEAQKPGGRDSEPERLQPPITGDDEAVIIYTSGTSGKPKGVLLTHGNLLSNAQQIAEWLQLTADDRALTIMPLFHVNALMATGLAALWAGGSIVLAPRFSASRLWETVSRYGVSYFGSVATMLSMINHTYPRGVPAELDVSRFRFALCGSAPVPAEVLKTFESLFTVPVIEGYGCRAANRQRDEGV
jgi:long-chain acyl-CoA synthetase